MKLKAMKGGTSYALDKHRRIVREMPVHVEKRMQNIAARNNILHSAVSYSARLERDRVDNNIMSQRPGLQRAATELHLGTLNQRVHQLATKRLVNINDCRHTPVSQAADVQ